MTLLAALAVARTTCAQQAPDPALQPAISEAAAINPVAPPCVQPTPLVRLQDYNGPFQKVIGLFAGPLERKSVHPVRYKSGVVLCTLGLKAKFHLFISDSIDPGTFVDSAFNAAISQAENTDPTFGQGLVGYSKRFGASYADQVSYRFFKDFAYPSIFGEDPRYYRLAYGSGKKRFLHALEHMVVAHHDNGSRMFNFSEWLGNASTITLSNLYHPGNRRGFVSFAQAFGSNAGSDIGFDVLREFWPEIAHKFKLPFRAEPNVPGEPVLQ